MVQTKFSLTLLRKILNWFANAYLDKLTKIQLESVAEILDFIKNNE